MVACTAVHEHVVRLNGDLVGTAVCRFIGPICAALADDGDIVVDVSTVTVVGSELVGLLTRLIFRRSSPSERVDFGL